MWLDGPAHPLVVLQVGGRKGKDRKGRMEGSEKRR